MRRGRQWCSHGATGNCSPCESIETPSGLGLKAHRDFLAPRLPEQRWLREASMYRWPLWRNWKPPKPIAVETTADIRKRERAWLRSAKPAGYMWRVEKLTPAQRIALGCLPKPAARARPTRTRVAA